MGKGQGSRAEAEEDDVSSSPKEDRGDAESKVGEGAEGGVKTAPHSCRPTETGSHRCD